MNQSDKVTIYSADRRGRSFFKILKEMFQSLPEAHELAQRLFKRNIKAMYRQSLLGFFWALVPPLVTAALWIFLRSNKVADFGETSVSYPVFVLTGTILWQIFTEAFNAPLTSINSNKSILIKINIPREGLLLSGIYILIFNLVIKLGLLTVIFVYFGQEISWSILMVPVGIGAIILCGFSLGMLLVPVGMLYQDIQKMIGVGLPFVMLLTPVIYPPKNDGIVGVIMKVNPMATLLTETRNWFTSQPSYDLDTFLYLSGVFFVLLALGLVVFKIAMPMIIERIGS
ncbi:MAG: ABC transporter permease [Cyclobacteriaceae bacterium]